jgi:hypothetical protein
VQISLTTAIGDVKYDSDLTTSSTIIDEIEGVGFDATILENKEISPPPSKEANTLNPLLASNNDSKSSGNAPKQLLLKIENVISENNQEYPDDLIEQNRNHIYYCCAKNVMGQSESNNISHLLVNEKRSEIISFLSSQIGVVTVDLDDKDETEMMIKLVIREKEIGPRKIVKLLEELGLQVSVSALGGGLARAARLLRQQENETYKHWRAFIISSIFTLPILFIAMKWIPNDLTKYLEQEILPGLSMHGLYLFILATPVEFWIAYRFHEKAFLTLSSCGKVGIGMDFLVSSGTGAAYFYSVLGLIRGLVSGKGCARDADTEYFETAAVL